MYDLVASSGEEAWLRCLALCKGGRMIAPRDKATLEAFKPVCVELYDPATRLVTNPYRNLNYTFGLMEAINVYRGCDKVENIVKYNKHIAEFSDDGRVFTGAYGPPFTDQFNYIVKTLRDDRDSRQAVMTIWKPSPKPSKDIPCTVMLHFMVRDMALDLTVYMRSNDVWLGFPYDIFVFGTLQEYVASYLKFRTGRYRHIVGSLHMYAGDVYKAEWALRYPGQPVSLPTVIVGDLSEISTLEYTGYKPKEYNSPFSEMHCKLILAYNKLIPAFPDPYATIRMEAKRVRAKFEDSAERSGSGPNALINPKGGQS